MKKHREGRRGVEKGAAVRTTPVLLASLALAASHSSSALAAATSVNRHLRTTPQLRVVYAVLEDDGDHDGWADSRETVAMRVAVRNLSGTDLTGLVLLVSTQATVIAGITDNRIAFGDLADGEMRLSDEAFEFVVADVERTAPADALSATFLFRSYADQYYLDALEAVPCVPIPHGWPSGSVHPPDCSIASELTLDLDLDAAGGGGATTFFEGFESGFGQFTTMHLDEALNPPPGNLSNHALGVAAADGSRCPYSDPGWEGSRSFNTTQGLVCYPSQDGVPDTYYWHLANERSFEGSQSLHYGVFLDAAALYTTPRANLEAIRTTEPINLGWADVCSVSRTQFCANDADCPSGESCEPSTPQFTFKHQISLVDCRSVNLGDNHLAATRGMVSVQLASETDGTPSGGWIRIEPYVNVYDAQPEFNYSNCTFDPADDGNTEADFFDPTDPLRSLGPSSTCYPNYNFDYQGSTILSDRSLLGNAADGPGFLAVDGGGIGPGTWVEPRFDLSRFRGRRLRLRFVTTSLKAGSAPLWHPQFVNNTAANPDVRDDGWFIDDVQVTGAVTTPATLAEDSTDNSGLPGLDDPDGDAAALDNCPLDHNPDQADADGDGRGDTCDDCPLDPYDDRYGAGACCPATAEDDADGDGLCGALDTCPSRFNPNEGAAYRVAPDATTGLLTADGQRVVYIESGNLRSVPVVGGAATLLYAKPSSHRGVQRIGQTPDGATIVFTADAQVAARYELHTVPATGGVAQIISAPLQTGPGVVGFEVAPDGGRVVYSDSNELYSVAVGGGPVVMLNPPEHNIYSSGFQLSADSSRVVYRRESPYELWAVPIAGGTPQLVVGPSIGSFWITPDATRVVFTRSSLYVVPIEGGPETQLSGPITILNYVNSLPFAFTPDGSRVVYVSDEETGGKWEVYSVGIDGTAKTRLAPELTDYFFAPLSIAPDGSRAVVRTQGVQALYSMDLVGGPAEQLASCSRGVFLIPPDSSAVVYSSCEALTGISTVPLTGGAPTRLAGRASWLDGHGPLDIRFDSSIALYGSGDPVSGGLFVVPLVPESDGDGSTFPCDCDPADPAVHPEAPEINDGQDNQCPGDPGHGQVDEVSGQATLNGSGTFTWPAQPGATMYEVARAASPDFTVGCSVVTTTRPSWTDTEEPPAGGLFFYLHRALAPNAGSWGVDSEGIERGPLCPEGP